MARTTNRIINAVDLSSLGCIGSGGQREISVASGTFEHVKLVGYAAPSPVRTRVVQCPVAVDESKSNAAIRLSAKQAMFVCEQLCEPPQGALEIFGGVMIMMQMNLDFAEPLAADVCERIDMARLVLI